MPTDIGDEVANFIALVTLHDEVLEQGKSVAVLDLATDHIINGPL